jgi:hypothetical protein
MKSAKARAGLHGSIVRTLISEPQGEAAYSLLVSSFHFLECRDGPQEVAEKADIGFELPTQQRCCTQCTQEVDEPSVLSVP